MYKYLKLKPTDLAKLTNYFIVKSLLNVYYSYLRFGEVSLSD